MFKVCDQTMTEERLSDSDNRDNCDKHSNCDYRDKHDSDYKTDDSNNTGHNDNHCADTYELHDDEVWVLRHKAPPLLCVYP